MIGFFKRASAPDTSALGAGAVAMRVPSGCTVPRGCVGLVCERGGQAQRAGAGQRLVLAGQESAWCFHPGPYCVDLLPSARAPELGLRLHFAVDSPDPRVVQQRFDLFIVSEGGDLLTVDGLRGAMEAALQRELAQGNLELPPCTTLEEWGVFRAGLNQLLYTRFGVSIEDCLPVDLGESADYAAMLQARRSELAAQAPVPAPARAAAPDDVRDLRRLFLELPCLMCALRLAVLPQGQAQFRQHQELLQRLDRVSLNVNTMPALELAAPGQSLPPALQAARAGHSAQAVAALDEAWALLARLGQAPAAALPALLADADRIVANLEHGCAARREVPT